MFKETIHFKLYTPFKKYYYYIHTSKKYKDFIEHINHKIKIPKCFDLYFLDKRNLAKRVNEIAINEENFEKFLLQNEMEVRAKKKEGIENGDFFFMKLSQRILNQSSRNFLKKCTRNVRENRKEKASKIIQKINPLPSKILLLEKMKITKKIPKRLIKNQNEEDDDQSSQMSIDKEKNDSISRDIEENITYVNDNDKMLKNCSRCNSIFDKKESDICENCLKNSKSSGIDPKDGTHHKKGNLFNEFNDETKLQNQSRTQIINNHSFFFQTLNSQKQECNEFTFLMANIEKCDKYINFVTNLNDFSLLQPKITGDIRDISFSFENQRIKLTFTNLNSYNPGRYNITIIFENSKKISVKPIKIIINK